MKYLLIAFFLVLFSSCKNDDGMNTGKSETTIWVVSIPGVTPISWGGHV
ncbi:hypothetical protein [Phaeocystidibacter marisrubri]|nr:hypothetical protein [Phaeocystidibacter marisrubri]